MPHFVGWTAAAVAGLAAVVIASIFGGGCAAEPTAAPVIVRGHDDSGLTPTTGFEMAL